MFLQTTSNLRMQLIFATVDVLKVRVRVRVGITGRVWAGSKSPFSYIFSVPFFSGFFGCHFSRLPGLVPLPPLFVSSVHLRGMAFLSVPCCFTSSKHLLSFLFFFLVRHVFLVVSLSFSLFFVVVSYSRFFRPRSFPERPGPCPTFF